MENEQPHMGFTPQNNLQITFQANEFFRTAAKWAKFLAILGFIYLGFIMLLIIFVAFFMPSFTSVFIIIFYGILLGVAALPVYFLHKFALNTERALFTKDSDALASGLSFLKTILCL